MTESNRPDEQLPGWVSDLGDTQPADAAPGPSGPPHAVPADDQPTAALPAIVAQRLAANRQGHNNAQPIDGARLAAPAAAGWQPETTASPGATGTTVSSAAALAATGLAATGLAAESLTAESGALTSTFGAQAGRPPGEADVSEAPPASPPTAAPLAHPAQSAADTALPQSNSVPPPTSAAPAPGGAAGFPHVPPAPNNQPFGAGAPGGPLDQGPPRMGPSAGAPTLPPGSMPLDAHQAAVAQSHAYQGFPSPVQAPGHHAGPPPGTYVAAGAAQLQPAELRPPGALTPPPGLDQINLIQRTRTAPRGGWRRAVYTATGGKVNPGDSNQQRYIDELTHRVRRPISGDYRIAVLSLKGGVGKTTTTVGLGSVFANLRGDRVIAVDANPDLGTLGGRVPQQTTSTVRTLLNDTALARYSDVRAHTNQAASRLEVLASERDPAVSESFSDEDYRRVIDVLQRHYNIIITDCGTGLMHSAMQGTLDLANALILVTSPAIDGAQSAAATLDWLEAHGYKHLVHDSVVVISAARPGSAAVDVDLMTAHFLGRVRAVQVIPFDPHLAEGANVDLELLHKKTQIAFTELAATVADGFGNPGADGRTNPVADGLTSTGADGFENNHH